MGTIATEIRKLLLPTDPYAGFDAAAYPKDLQGGEITDAMLHLFETIKPRLLIEVGCWKGRSACFWASLMKQMGIDGAVVCIDTWLGGLEHLESHTSPEWKILPYLKHGYPTLYHQFLANVVQEGFADTIIPIPNTSLIAARWLAKNNLVADLIFVDGSHDEDDLYHDLKAYWPLLRMGGVICGDDFLPEWYSVICGVNKFAREIHANLQVQGRLWAIQKQPDPAIAQLWGAVNNEIAGLKKQIEK